MIDPKKLKRYRELAVTGVALLSLHCDDGTYGSNLYGQSPPSMPPPASGPVGGPPPPPGSGGVAPAPAPAPAPTPPAAACTAAGDPFDALQAEATAAEPGQLFLYLRAGLVGLRVTKVRVTGGTLIAVVDQNTANPQNPYLVVVLRATGRLLLVETDLACGSDRTTRRFRVSYNGATAGAALTVVEIEPT